MTQEEQIVNELNEREIHSDVVEHVNALITEMVKRYQIDDLTVREHIRDATRGL
jgi:hypothetical protein